MTEHTDYELKFDKAFDKFMGHVNSVFDKYWNDMGFTHSKSSFEVVEGKRYVKVVRNDVSQKSVHLFVDKTNGNVLKAKSWKGPETKNPRGNIFNEDNGLGSLTPHGTVYLR